MKWIKASERLPERESGANGPVKQIVTKRVFPNGYCQITSFTANQMIDLAKHGQYGPDQPETFWLDETPLPTPASVEEAAKEVHARLKKFGYNMDEDAVIIIQSALAGHAASVGDKREVAAKSWHAAVVSVKWQASAQTDFGSLCVEYDDQKIERDKMRYLAALSKSKEASDE